MRRRWLYVILIAAFLFALMPYLFWQASWFGRPLDDAQLAKNLADRDHPRKAQHALSQIADRMASPNPAVRESARRWYPQVAALAASPVDELRLTAAWVMGQEPSVKVPPQGCPDARDHAAWARSESADVQEFHRALLRLLDDAHPMVRRNAALSLVHFCDGAGRPVIVSMLEPFGILAPRAGALAQRLKPGDIINPGTLLGRIQDGELKIEVRSRVPGTLDRWVAANASSVSLGQPIAFLSPSVEMVWEALRALYIIGQPEDLSAVQPYIRPGRLSGPGAAELPSGIYQQAQNTVAEIRRRAAPRP